MNLRQGVLIGVGAILVATMAVWAQPAHAQEARGYGMAGPAGYSGFFGTRSRSVHAAGGGEVLAGSRLGVGAELGLFNRLVVGSTGATLHVGPGTIRMLAPFVAAGYSRMGIGDGEGAFTAWHLAVGGDYWMTPRRGVRFEFRDHIRPDSRGAVQYWSLRFGLVFRR